VQLYILFGKIFTHIRAITLRVRKLIYSNRMFIYLNKFLGVLKAYSIMFTYDYMSGSNTADNALLMMTGSLYS
jgi:hypothetical protein